MISDNRHEDASCHGDRLRRTPQDSGPITTTVYMLPTSLLLSHSPTPTTIVNSYFIMLNYLPINGSQDYNWTSNWRKTNDVTYIRTPAADAIMYAGQYVLLNGKVISVRLIVTSS